MHGWPAGHLYIEEDTVASKKVQADDDSGHGKALQQAIHALDKGSGVGGKGVGARDHPHGM